MRAGIHPQYRPVVFRDASTGDQFLTRSAATSAATVLWADGVTYPLITVDVTSYSHPFWTGTQRIVRRRRAGREIPPSLRAACPHRQQFLMAVPKRRTSRSRGGIWTSRPSITIRTRVGGLAFHCARRDLVQRRRFFVPSLGRTVRLRVSTTGLKIIDRRGIDAVVADLIAKGVDI